jgi:hypothetical protein
MLRTRSLPLTLAFCVLLVGAADAATVLHSEPLRGYRVGASAGATASMPTATGPTTISFNAFSRDFTLDLEPNGRLARMQEQLRLPNGTGAYRGRIAGRSDSWVRIVLTPAGPTGLLYDGDTLYGIEIGGERSAAGGAMMFRLADVYFAPGEIGGADDAVAIDGAYVVAALAEEFVALAAEGASLNIDIGAVGDFEFAQAFALPPGPEAALLARFNNVDGLFSAQLGVQITVAEVDVFTANDDPFTTSAAAALLDQLASYRAATPAQEAQGLTHMFTGRDLDGSTAGIAFTGAVCAHRPAFPPSETRSFGAGLSQARFPPNSVVDSLIAAHEIGHNFGAPHDGDANGACATTPTTFLMAPSINGNDQFSECSIDQMQIEIATASCLTPIGPANVTVFWAQPPQSTLAGVSFTHGATIRNVGADPASGVTFTATAEAGLQIVSADAGGASCNVAGSSVTCTLGAVGAGASRTATLTLRAAAAGAFDLTATVAADVDDNANDNDDAVAFTIVPSVDLVMSGSSPGVALNAQTTINALLQNAADVTATTVAVTATASGGLRPDAATLGGATCTITGQAISCPTRTLTAQESVTLAVTVTGIIAGNQPLTVSVTASEPERTPADNQLTIAVSVNAPQQGGGGGALSWWVVAFLLAAHAVSARATSGRRRRSLPTPSGI